MILGRFCLIWVICLLLSPCPGLAAAPQSGVIEGSLSYPSEFIPDDMTICAENLATKKIYSTNKHLKAKKYQYKVGYKLTVPPGDYHVYAQLPDPARYGADLSQGLPGLLLGIRQMRHERRMQVPCAHCGQGKKRRDRQRHRSPGLV